MNPKRLEKSLDLLRRLNDARATGPLPLVRKLEVLLKQHDYDARDKIDARQMNIYEFLR